MSVTKAGEELRYIVNLDRYVNSKMLAVDVYPALNAVDVVRYSKETGKIPKNLYIVLMAEVYGNVGRSSFVDAGENVNQDVLRKIGDAEVNGRFNHSWLQRMLLRS